MSETLSPIRSESGPAPAGLRAWMLLLVGILAVVVYANTLYNGFTYDDVGVVKENAHVIHLEWTTIWTDNYWKKVDGQVPDVLYRPLTLWTYLANEALTPGAAWSFHLVNVVLNALVSVLVSVLAWRLTRHRAIALVAGILFAVHPLHTEVVANIVGRAELLATMWSLVLLLIYLPEAPLSLELQAPRRGYWHGILVAICFFAAVLCKETPATLLVAVVFIDAWLWWRLQAGRPRFLRFMAGRAVRYYVPMAVAFAVYLMLRLNACGVLGNTAITHPVVNPLISATVGERIVTPFLLLAKYLSLIFWPAKLSADYSFPSLLPTANPLNPNAAAGLLGCALAFILSVRWRRTRPLLLLLMGLFFISYMLVANVLRIGTIFGERLFYLPSVFVLILVSWCGVLLYQQAAVRSAGRVAGALLMAAAVVAMGWRTYTRNTDWVDNTCLAIATARDNPNSAKACAWAGAVLAVADRPDFVDVGRMLLERAAELAPRFDVAHWELSKYYGRQHEIALATIEMAKAVRLDPGSHMSGAAIHAAFAEFKQDPPESYMPGLEAYQAEHPDDPVIYFSLALACHAQGRLEEAEAHARKAVEVGNLVTGERFIPFHEAAAVLACIRIERGNIDEGLPLMRQYVMMIKHSIEGRLTIANLLINMDHGRYPFALAEADMNLSKAEALDAGDARIRTARAALARKQKDVLTQTTATVLPHTPDNSGGIDSRGAP